MYKTKLVCESLDELNEGRFGRSIAGAALGAALSIGGVSAQSGNITKERIEFAKEFNEDLSFKHWAKYYQSVNDGTPLSYEQWVILHLMDIDSNQQAEQAAKDIMALRIENNTNKKPPVSNDSIVYSAMYKELQQLKQQQADNEYAQQQKVVLISKAHIKAGEYKIKGVNQILTGVGLNLAGAFVTLQSTNALAKNMVKDNPTAVDAQENKILRAGQVVGVLMGITGVGLEISGIVNIKNAGIALKANGISLSYKF